MRVVLLLFFNVLCMHAAATDSETSFSEQSADSPRIEGHCIAVPCSSLTGRNGKILKPSSHTSLEPLIATAKHNNKPTARLIRHGSVSSFLELSRSEESPRSNNTNTQMLAQALPSPTAAYITDTQIARLMQKLKNTASHNASFISVLSAFSVLKTADARLIHQAYASFADATNDATVIPQRDQVFNFYHASLLPPSAIRLVAWIEYQKSIMALLNNHLKQKLPGITTEDNNRLRLKYSSPPSNELSPEQISMLHQHVLSYAYMLSEQEEKDPELFAQIFAQQRANYAIYLSSIQQLQSAKPLEQFSMRPMAIHITQNEINNIIRDPMHMHSSPMLAELLGGISIASLQTAALGSDAQKLFMAFMQHPTTAGPRRCALDMSQSIGMRSECWQAYHLAIMQQLNDWLKEEIPDITTDATKLYLSLQRKEGSPALLTIEQAKALQLYILVYALMLSEQEGTDLKAFEHTFAKQLHFLQPLQPHRALMQTRRSGSTGSIARFRGKFSWTQRGGASSSSGI